MLSTLSYVALSAVLFDASPGQSEPAPRQIPHEVWMDGSHIATPEARATWELRDALEAEIASADRAPPPEQTPSDVIIYLPAMVTFTREELVFSYRAVLSDRQFHPIREVTGKCTVNGLKICASEIYRRLTAAE